MGGRYALAIGVRKSGLLPSLDGAVADALAFAEWAQLPGQGYTTAVITDKNQSVTVDRIKCEINRILEEDVERLIIFYSGHGICSQAGDYWLLSNYHKDSDEAINLSQSLRNGRRLGIGQLAVFSDACRTSLNNAALVGGRVIFPFPSGGRALSRYDEFLSTDIGDAAQEIPEADVAKSYGVFSRCLLTALHGLEPEAIEDRAPRKVITSIGLANWLEKAVPLQSGKIPGAAVQYPSITTGWRAPDDEYSELISPENKAANFDLQTPVGRRLLSSVTEGVTMGLAERRALKNIAQAKIEADKVDREKLLDERTQSFLASRDRELFARDKTLTIIGSEIVNVVTPRGVDAEILEKNGLWHVVCRGKARSIALCTRQGMWISATPLPKFVGTLVVGKHGVESLNYAPPRQSFERELNERSDRILARWNAILSIGRDPDPSALQAFADEARIMKHMNPALGILAAYAYERVGQINQVASIAWYFATRNGFVPFDIMALLSDYGKPRQMIAEHGYTPRRIVIAGDVPFLTRGWSLFDPDGGAYSKHAKLRRGLKESVWTTFDAETGTKFANLIADEGI